MRLQVFISHSGFCSRRAAFDLVRNGKVSVNGSIVNEPSFDVQSGKDNVSIDGRKISIEKKEYILLNKPREAITTRKDKFASKTVFDCLPKDFRHLYPVGRLDKDTQGLLIFTNDGDLAFRLMHPKFFLDKEYLAGLSRDLSVVDKERIEKGIMLDGKLTSPAKIIFGKIPSSVKIIIHEGRKRQIRRMFFEAGYEVITLKRIGYGPIRLGDLSDGKWRYLSQKEIDELFKSTSLKG